MSKSAAVVTQQLTKTFSGKEVVHLCNMTVDSGTIYGFVGKNGAGKTTVFKMLLGLLKPTMGTATVLGKDSVKDNSEILRRTGSLIETPIFYEHLSASENLKIHLAYMGLESDNTSSVLDLVGLHGTGTQAVSTFSMGMRQRLGIARALVHKPELLILDEPINGLDPVGIKEVRELLRRLSAEEHYTILLSSHILSEVEQISDKIGIIVNGTIVQETTPEIIRANNPGGIEDYFIKITSGGFQNE